MAASCLRRLASSSSSSSSSRCVAGVSLGRSVSVASLTQPPPRTLAVAGGVGVCDETRCFVRGNSGNRSSLSMAGPGFVRSFATGPKSFQGKQYRPIAEEDDEDDDEAFNEDSEESDEPEIHIPDRVAQMFKAKEEVLKKPRADRPPKLLVPENLDYSRVLRYLKERQHHFFETKEFNFPHDYIPRMPVKPADYKPDPVIEMEGTGGLKDFNQSVLAKQLLFTHVRTWARKHGHFSASEKEGYVWNCLLLAGNMKGFGGFGQGKATTLESAMRRARKDVYKNLMFVPLVETNQLPHEVSGQFNSCRVLLKPNYRGHGSRCGTLLFLTTQLIGIEDVVGCIEGRRWSIKNQIYAIFDALSKLKSPKQDAEDRGKTAFWLYDPVRFNPRIRYPWDGKDMKPQSEHVRMLLEYADRRSIHMRRAQKRLVDGVPVNVSETMASGRTIG